MEKLDFLIIDFLMNSNEFELKDFDLKQVNQDLKPLISGLLRQYFFLKKINPQNDKLNDSGIEFLT